jgi:two-component system OmpR family response regulator
VPKILVVEDDRELVEILRVCLKNEGYNVDIVEDGESGLYQLSCYPYDAAILDWNLPLMSGPAICQGYRNSGGQAPILMLTGMSNIVNKEQGFEAGADDYLTKPFDTRELMIRLRALLKRPPQRLQNILKLSDLAFDPISRVVRKSGEELHLLPKELALLEFLLRHPDEPFSAEALLDRIWPSVSDVSTELIEVHISRLRKKIDSPGMPSLIQTVHGVGYKLTGSG